MIAPTTAPYGNGFFIRILNYQTTAINYVLLSKDICKGVKRVIIRIVFNTGPIPKEHKRVVNAPPQVLFWPMFQECIQNKFEKVKFDNQNTSDVNLAWSIWKNAINEASLDVIGKSRKVIFFYF